MPKRIFGIEVMRHHKDDDFFKDLLNLLLG